MFLFAFRVFFDKRVGRFAVCYGHIRNYQRRRRSGSGRLAAKTFNTLASTLCRIFVYASMKYQFPVSWNGTLSCRLWKKPIYFTKSISDSVIGRIGFTDFHQSDSNYIGSEFVCIIILCWFLFIYRNNKEHFIISKFKICYILHFHNQINNTMSKYNRNSETKWTKIQSTVNASHTYSIQKLNRKQFITSSLLYIKFVKRNKYQRTHTHSYNAFRLTKMTNCWLLQCKIHCWRW